MCKGFYKNIRKNKKTVEILLWQFLQKYSKIERKAAGECLMIEKMKKFWQIIAAILLFLGAFGGMSAARTVSGFADWYGTRIYPVLAGILGRISGLFSFSIVEAGIYGLAVLIIFYGIRHIKKPWLLIKNGLFLASCLCFLYVAACGINYSRTPFSQVIGFDTRDSSEEELYRLCEFLTEQVIQVSRKETGQASQNQALTFKEAWNMGKEGVKAMEKLGKTYLSWRILSKSETSGHFLDIIGAAAVRRIFSVYD